MKRWLVFALATVLLTGARSAAVAAGTALTPLSPGFHQVLTCTPRGYVSIDVAAADPKIAPHAAIVTTAIAAGTALGKTVSVRESDAQGNIYALGYVLQPGVVKRFARRLLLPAAPPAAGQRSTYLSPTGVVVDKRFEGPRATRDGAGRPATGYAFADYLSGRKLNAIVYVPGTGVTEARFFGLAGGSDLVCGLTR